MRYGGIVLILISLLFIFAACGGSSTDSGYEPDETTTYLLTFKSTWSAQTHPLDFPSAPHFSGLVGAVHNEMVVLWKEGSISSDGVKDVAEKGSKTQFSNEVDPIIISGEAYVKMSGSGITVSPGTATLRFTAHRDLHFITVISMLAPSPDWFVGVSGMNLFENDDWIIEKTVDLYVYDAGTDSGKTYTAADQPTEPRAPIGKITDYAFSVSGKVTPVATFTFKRL